MPLPRGAAGAVLGAVLSMLTTQLIVELVKAESEPPAGEGPEALE